MGQLRTLGLVQGLMALGLVAAMVVGTFIDALPGRAVRAAADVTAFYVENVAELARHGYPSSLVLKGDDLNGASGGEKKSRPCAPPAGVPPSDACIGWMRVTFAGVRHLDDPEMTWTANFAAPLGEKLAAGTYTGAVYPLTRAGDQPGISVGLGTSGGYCTAPTGSFTIHEISWSGDDLVSFSATFKQVCSGDQEVWGPLWGEVRYHASSGFRAAVWNPWALDFGQTDTGTSTARKDLTITSAGTQAIHLGSAAITGSGSGSFAVEADTCSGATLSPGQSCAVDVSAQPRRNGNIAAALVIPDDTVRGERNVRLTVEGLGEAEASATISPTKFYPVVDGYRDRLTVDGVREEAISVEIDVTAVVDGALVQDGALPAGTGNFRWSWGGRVSGGDLAPAGQYDVSVTLRDEIGNTKVVTKRITLSHAYVTWTKHSVTLSGRRYSLYGTYKNGRVSIAGSRYRGGVRLLSKRGSATVVYVFPVKSAKIYGPMWFKILGRSVNRHKAVIAVWNRSLGGYLNLSHYDAGKLVGPGYRWWTTRTDGEVHVKKRKARAMVITWKGLGRSGRSVFDIKKVRLIYKTGVLHSANPAALMAEIAAAPGQRGHTVTDLGGSLVPHRLSLRPNPPESPSDDATTAEPTARPAATEAPPPTEPAPHAGAKPTTDARAVGHTPEPTAERASAAGQESTRHR